MNEATAKQSVDFMFSESGDSPSVNLTFFGGETLLNFKMLQSALAYAKDAGRALGKQVNASLTTNATLLREEMIDWMVRTTSASRYRSTARASSRTSSACSRTAWAATTSCAADQDAARAAQTAPRRRARYAHGQNLDVASIYRHLFEEIGFWEVGFAPVTTSWQREYAIEDEGFQQLLGGFQTLAAEYLDALAGKRHGFSNVRDTLEEIHKGMSKAYPCGAGLGLMGVATDGDVALCHRFAGSDEHKLGSVFGGVDHSRRTTSSQAPHREQDGLRHVLGAAAVRRRLLPRSAHAVRVDGRAEPALLRVDSRLDEHLSRSVRHAGGAEAGVSRAVRFLRPNATSEIDQPEGATHRVDARERRRRAAAGRTANRAAHPARLLVRFLAWLGGRQQRRHGWPLPAGRARPVRLPPHVLLAGARARSVQLCARLDREVRIRRRRTGARST